MQTKKLLLAAGLVAALACSNRVNAQSTSYDANTIPIGGTQNSAFGSGALNSTTGIANIGMGYEALYTNTTGNYNTGLGYQTLYASNGDLNTAVGFRAMKNNQTGQYNTASGAAALYTNAYGSNNVANGYYTLFNNIQGNNNSAMGYYALYSNITGSENVVNGESALYNNTQGSYNVADGSMSLYSNVSGDYNVALGYQALYANTASENTALGFRAMKNNQTGTYNTATGEGSLYTNAYGNNNTSAGYFALYNNLKGNNNTATGSNALYNNQTGDCNTADGNQALATNMTGSLNTALGCSADVSVDGLTNATAIGEGAIVDASNKVRIGDPTVTVIEGAVPFSPSDVRFKENITEDVKGLDFIKLLRPVVYNFNTRKFEEFLTKNMTPDQKKAHLDGKDFGPSTAIRQTGFIAQEVEKSAKQIGYDFSGLHAPESDNDNYSLSYAQFVVPLVKAVQEQQKMIEQLQQQLADLQKTGSNAATTTSTDQIAVALSGASLDQNVPNPYSHETVINFNLPQQVSNASMIVYDLQGKQLQSFPITQRGASSITITSDNLAAGMYLYSLVADGSVVGTKRMVVANK